MVAASQTVTSEIHDDHGVAVITVDDGKANALSSEVIAAVSSAVGKACSDDKVGAIVIAGRDGRFSGGFDLSVMQSGDWSAIVNLVADGGELVRTLYGCDRPVVAACGGHAVAAGALMLLGCDVRVGGDGPYKIGLNEVAIGMVLPDWAMTMVRERIALRHHQRCVATAHLYTPTDAVHAGFLDHVVAPHTVLERAITEASILARLDRRAYAKTVEVFRGHALELTAQQLAADRAAAG